MIRVISFLILLSFLNISICTAATPIDENDNIYIKYSTILKNLGIKHHSQELKHDNNDIFIIINNAPQYDTDPQTLEKTLSLSLYGGYIPASNKQLNYIPSSPYFLQLEYNLLRNLSVGIGYQSYKRENKSNKNYLDINITPLSVIFYPFYAANTSSPFIGFSIYNINPTYKDKEGLFANEDFITSSGYEYFIGYQIALGKQVYTNIKAAYQFRLYEGNINGSDIIEYDDSLALFIGFKL